MQCGEEMPLALQYMGSWQGREGAVGFRNNRRPKLSLVRKETASVQKENELGTETTAIR